MHTVGQAMIAVGNDLEKCDVIEHGFQLWLVPYWLDSPEEGWTAPARIICLSKLSHNEASFADCRWVVSHPIPRGVLDGTATAAEAARFHVIERPPIRFQGPRGVH